MTATSDERCEWLRTHLREFYGPDRSIKRMRRLVKQARAMGLTVLMHRDRPNHVDRMSIFDPETGPGPEDDGKWYEYQI